MSFRLPVNVQICKAPGTIFSSSTGNNSGSGSGGDYTFTNLGTVGARVYAQTIARNVQFRRLVQGPNVTITENANDITIAVNDLLFDGNRAIKRATPGIQGVNLGTTSVLTLLEQLLFPTLAPIVALNLVPTLFEFGDATPLTANWSVTKTDEPILTIGVGGFPQTATGNTQNGVQSIPKSGTLAVAVKLQATTATKSAEVTVTATPSRKIRYGQSTNNGQSTPITDANISALTGVFSSTAIMGSKNVHIDVNNYLVIEIPVSLGQPSNFKTNGFVNNAFNLVRTNSAYTNPFGFVEPVNVWVSQQFSTGDITLEIV